jgi:hypothetical protein
MRSIEREKKGKYVNEQLFLCTAIVCLFLNLIVFLFYITQFIVASYKHPPPSEQLNETKITWPVKKLGS